MASEGGWYLMSDNPYIGVRRYGLDLPDGTIIRTEYYQANTFMEANQRQRNETAGQRFGAFRHVASTPMHIWAKEIVPRRRQGDEKSLKKWLNNADQRPFRTFEGDI
jgi:hypothetical protein